MSERPPSAASPPPAPGRTPGRGPRLVLIVSLGVNLVVIGLVVGVVINHVRRDDRPIVRDLGFGPYAAALSHEDRTALGQAFARETGGFRAKRRVARAAFARLLDILRTDPLDQAALEQVMQQQGQRAAGRVALGQKLLLQRLQMMTPAERRGFADRLQEALAHRGHNRRRSSHPPANTSGNSAPAQP